MPTSDDWVASAQAELERQGLAAWLIYDFRGLNPVAGRFLMPGGGMLSRRVFLLVPARGRPTLLVHAIERGSLAELPFTVRSYTSRQSLAGELGAMLPRGKVALEYSPLGDNPYVAHVDAGTIELIRSLGVEPVGSADLLQVFSVWSEAQIEAHERAAEQVLAAVELAFEFIALQAQTGRSLAESEVQKIITDFFGGRRLVYDHPPIVAFGPNAGDPHYAPQPGRERALQPGDAILIDLWARYPDEGAPYADVTWMGCYGEPSAELERVFGVVVQARDLAVRAIADGYRAGRRPQGWEIDRAVRDFITAEGYGEAFVHRTGHSLGWRFVHGDAVHLDDFETRDTRRLDPGIGVTVEPGVYLEGFGVRSEIDVLLTADGPRVTTEAQRELIVVPLGPT